MTTMRCKTCKQHFHLNLNESTGYLESYRFISLEYGSKRTQNFCKLKTSLGRPYGSTLNFYQEILMSYSIQKRDGIQVFFRKPSMRACINLYYTS